MLKRILGAGAAALIGLLAALAPATAADTAAGKGLTESLSEAQTRAVEQVIRDYLLENPELLLEVMERLEAKQKAAARESAKERIGEHRTALFESPGDYVVNKDGVVPMVEFFDYQCGYCKRVLPTVMRVMAEQDEVRLVFKEFPILGPASTYAAKAALAARNQGMYLEFHNALMGQRAMNEDAVLATAAHLGLDTERLQKDMESPEIAAIIDENLRLGQAMGIRGTPTLVIGDNLVPGAVDYQQMLALIEEARTDCRVC